MTLSLCQLKSRDEFPEWLNTAGLTDEGAEIGVFEGEFSALLMAKWIGDMLHGIDPFIPYPKEEWRDGCNRTDLPEMGKKTAERFSLEQRYNLIMQPSLEAVLDFDDGQLDFVYVDGNHRYESTRDDIKAWWPKVHSGGVIGLHDFYQRDDDGQLGNVARAVWEFCYSIKIPFWVTPCTTAWIIKP